MEDVVVEEVVGGVDIDVEVVLEGVEVDVEEVLEDVESLVDASQGLVELEGIGGAVGVFAT